MEKHISDELGFSRVKAVAAYLGIPKLRRADGFKLFRKERDNLKCCVCGIEASEWRTSKFFGIRCLNLYAKNSVGKTVLLTQDHIIPRSLGGCNSLHNLRIMCQPCNVKRGNNATIFELLSGSVNEYRLPNGYIKNSGNYKPLIEAIKDWSAE